MTPYQYTLCATLARWLPGRYGDAVAALVDRVSELASAADSLNDEINGCYSQLTAAVHAAGAPDASSLVGRIEELRRSVDTALSLRVEAQKERDALGNSVTNASVLLCDCGASENCGIHSPLCRRRSSLSDGIRCLLADNAQLKSRIADLESRPIIADRAATPALVRLAFAARKIRALMSEGGGIQSHAHRVPGIWDEDNGPDRAGKPCEQCATVIEFRRAVDELSEPSPLPTVVTCGNSPSYENAKRQAEAVIARHI